MNRLNYVRYRCVALGEEFAALDGVGGGRRADAHAVLSRPGMGAGSKGWDRG
jgi:hypothetical protein